MVVLGISGSKRDAAAALAVDGRIVAAASEESFVRVPGVGYRMTGGLPSKAIAACLERAKLSLADVRKIVCSSPDDLGGLPVRPISIPNSTADAALAAACWPDVPSIAIVLDADGDEDGAVFVSRPGNPVALVGRIGGWGSVTAVARRIARSLAVAGAFSEAFGHQASLAPEGRPADFGGAVGWDAAGGFRVDQVALEAHLAAAGVSDEAAEPAADLYNIRLLEARRTLAAGLQSLVVSAICGVVRAAWRREGVGVAAFGGSLFADSHLNAALWLEFDDAARIAPVPEACGRALGAALYAGLPAGDPLVSLGVGPVFTEQEIKTALDNCRLDYLYDPHWEKLVRRVSSLLARGKVVGWFQGPMEFGPRSLGGRSVLADPSDRFARDNILKFLKQQDQDESLAVSIRDCDVSECLVLPVASPHMLLRAEVVDAWRNRFRAALDHEHTCRLHTVTKESAPALWDLLRVHQERWGGVALLHTTLSGADETTACTPRDAIRTFYSSSIDALVMGRFLLMKDYWLLRSDADM